MPVDAAIAFLDALADGEDAVMRLVRGRGNGADETKTRETLRRTTFAVVAMENERGRALVEGGDLCERKNGLGVDPNRNWGVDWGKKAPDYDPKEEFPGERAFSEPESRMLRELVKNFKPHAFVNWHSGMEAILTPYDHVAKQPKGTRAQVMNALARAVNEAHCGGRCVLGSGGEGVGYLAHGTATDYIYEKMNVPIVFTWEVYGDTAAPYEDCFRAFNPTTPEAYKSVVDAWAGAPVTLASMLDMYPDVKRALKSDVPGALSPPLGDNISLAVPFVSFVAVGALVLRRRRFRRSTL